MIGSAEWPDLLFVFFLNEFPKLFKLAEFIFAASIHCIIFSRLLRKLKG